VIDAVARGPSARGLGWFRAGLRRLVAGREGRALLLLRVRCPGREDERRDGCDPLHVDPRFGRASRAAQAMYTGG
jgi:hypothetical protein